MVETEIIQNVKIKLAKENLNYMWDTSLLTGKSRIHLIQGRNVLCYEQKEKEAKLVGLELIGLAIYIEVQHRTNFSSNSRVSDLLFALLYSDRQSLGEEKFKELHDLVENDIKFKENYWIVKQTNVDLDFAMREIAKDYNIKIDEDDQGGLNS